MENVVFVLHFSVGFVSPSKLGLLCGMGIGKICLLNCGCTVYSYGDRAELLVCLAAIVP